MCNDYGNRVPYSAYLEAFSHLKIRLFTPGGAPNLEPRDDIWPTDVAPIIRANKDGAELIQLRWGFPPARPKGPPVINMRSEKRRFPRRRCLVPVSHFYAFTGKRSPKDKWRFTRPSTNKSNLARGIRSRHHCCTSARTQRSGAASSDPERIIVQLSTKLLPEATWTAAGIGRHQYAVNRWCLELGGHCRTGLEDRSRWLSLVFAIPHFSNSA